VLLAPAATASPNAIVPHKVDENTSKMGVKGLLSPWVASPFLRERGSHPLIAAAEINLVTGKRNFCKA